MQQLGTGRGGGGALAGASGAHFVWGILVAVLPARRRMGLLSLAGEG